MYRELEKTKLDTKTKLISAIASEYVSKLKGKAEKISKKSKNVQTMSALAEKITFADITVWFYKKNCPQSLEEARMIWETLPETIIQKQDVTNYFQAYTEQVLEKHIQYINYISQCKKIEKLISRTTYFTNNIKGALPQLSRSSFDESNLSSPEYFTFQIVLDSIEDHDSESLFQRNDLLGIQIEFSCPETNIKSSLTQAVSNITKLQQEKITVQLNPRCEAIDVKLFEVYGSGGEIAETKCIARRNLDLFTNINEWYMREILAYARANEQEIDSDGNIMEVESEYLKEKWENSRKFETFLLKKQCFSDASISLKKKKDFTKSSLDQKLVRLSMSIEIPAIESVQDFQSYLALCDARADYLAAKLRNTRAQALIYKKSISLLLAPLKPLNSMKNLSFLKKNSRGILSMTAKFFKYT